jgi:transcriptional regulator with XRE-family HTH domain
MSDDHSTANRRGLEMAQAFGALVRNRRRALKMTQDQLALATGVGRRFLIELEAGKPSCQLGRSLLVAKALGLGPADILSSQPAVTDDADVSDLPEMMEEPDGPPASVL